MLQRGKDDNLLTIGFLISVDIADGQTTPEDISRKLADSLSWVEGVGDVHVDCLGSIDVYPDQLEDI